MQKNVAFLVVFILAMASLIMVPAHAQVGVTTPSEPIFSVSYKTFSTDIPPVYGVDPSTGKAVVTQAGYIIVEEWAYVDILNQPFVPYKDSTGNNIQLFYNVRWRDPSNTSWICLDEVKNSLRWPQESNGEHTICSFDFKDNRIKGFSVLDLPIGGETDFQVKTAIGYYTADDVFVGKTTDWVDPQAIQHVDPSSIQHASSSPQSSQPPSLTPSQPVSGGSVLFGLGWAGVAVLVLLGVIAVLLVFVVVYLRRRSMAPK